MASCSASLWGRIYRQRASRDRCEPLLASWSVFPAIGHFIQSNELGIESHDQFFWSAWARL